MLTSDAGGVNRAHDEDDPDRHERNTKRFEVVFVSHVNSSIVFYRF